MRNLCDTIFYMKTNVCKIFSLRVTKANTFKDKDKTKINEI